MRGTDPNRGPRQLRDADSSGRGRREQAPDAGQHRRDIRERVHEVHSDGHGSPKRGGGVRRGGHTPRERDARWRPNVAGAEPASRWAQPAGRQGDDGSTSHHADAEGERLQKVLSRAGLASRREAEDWIRAGRITVNGQPAVLGARVAPSDQLRLDGRLIRQRETGGSSTAFVVHRSPGESLIHPSDTAAEGEEPVATTALIERLPSRAGKRFITVSPMPRVDGGLELVTSDGELGVRLQRSVRHLVSQFSVRVLGELTAEQLENILGGVLDSGEQIAVEACEPAGGEGANRWYTFVARGASGKEVRQLFERQGALVSRVQRTHLGPVTMERSLGRGHFRELTTEELQALLTPASPEEP